MVSLILKISHSEYIMHDKTLNEISHLCIRIIKNINIFEQVFNRQQFLVIIICVHRVTCFKLSELIRIILSP